MNKRDLEGVLGRKEFKALIDIRNDPFFKGKEYLLLAQTEA